MNILLIGSGGREHALAWKIAGSSALRPALHRAGQSRHGAMRDQRRPRSRRSRRGRRLLPGGGDRSRRGRPRGAAGRRPRRRSRGRRHQGVRAAPGGGAARRLEGLHQGALRRVRHPDRRLRALHARRTPPRPMCASEGAPIVVKADGLAAGKGVVVAATRRRSRGGHRRHARRRARRGRRRARHRGVPRRRGGELLRPLRRHDRDPARHGAGPQARLRRRPGPEHRRHGRLFARAGADAATLEARVMREIVEPTLAGMRRARHAFRRRALCRADDHRGRAEADRIQRPLRRSRMPGADAAPEERSRRRAAGRLRRGAREASTCAGGTMRR